MLASERPPAVALPYARDPGMVIAPASSHGNMANSSESGTRPISNDFPQRNPYDGYDGYDGQNSMHSNDSAEQDLSHGYDGQSPMHSNDFAEQDLSHGYDGQSPMHSNDFDEQEALNDVFAELAAMEMPRTREP